MGWFSGNNDGDGSRMKVTNKDDSHKVERISSEDRPHSHDIVKIDKPSGSVKEIHIGPNVSRGKK